MDAVRATARTQSPAPSPHGAIGDIPGHSQGHGHGSHGRSSSIAAQRPSTPRSNPPTASSSADGDELDLSALMAHGQRQLELDRSRFGRFGIPPAPVSAGSGGPLRGRTGFGVSVGGDGRADSPSRWPNNDEWRETGSRSRDASMHRQGSAGVGVGVVGSGNIPNSTPNGPSLSFMDQPFPSPIGRPRGSMGSIPFGNGGAPNAATEPAQAAQHHLQALSNVIGPLCQQNDEVIRLRAEVELWRGEWQRCDRERRRLESIVKSDDPVKGRPKFSVALIDGDGLIVSMARRCYRTTADTPSSRTSISVTGTPVVRRRHAHLWLRSLFWLAVYPATRTLRRSRMRTPSRAISVKLSCRSSSTRAVWATPSSR